MSNAKEYNNKECIYHDGTVFEDRTFAWQTGD